MKTILEVLTLSTDYLKQRAIKNPRSQAEELLAAALSIRRMDLYLEFERPLTELELETCRKYLARRGKGEPLQYIQGEVNFLDCAIEVNPHVLIPRQETEILVDKIIQELAAVSTENKHLWDLCSGSGCIGIALKKRLPSLQVKVSDLSSEAIKVAQRNAVRNGVEVDILQGDLLKPFEREKAHFIVCNPPYISEGDFHSLEPEVRCYEPKMALVGGKEGLEFYKRLAEELPAFMHPSGKVWLEIGHDQGKAIHEIFKNPPWKGHSLQKDWAGLERFFSLEIE